MDDDPHDQTPLDYETPRRGSDIDRPLNIGCSIIVIGCVLGLAIFIVWMLTHPGVPVQR